MTLKKRSKIERIAMWPRNFYRAYCITGDMTKRQRLHMAFILANAIVRN